jgi:hypothetical protein
MIGRRYYFVVLVALAVILSAAVPLTVSADEMRVSPAEHIAERVQEIQTNSLSAVAPEGARLVRAELLTHTNTDNKDKDTCIYVFVTTKDTASLLARIVRADCSANDSTEYNDGSDHFIELVVQNVAATIDASRGFQVTIGVVTTCPFFDIPLIGNPFCQGNDRWLFDAQVVLYFSDGSTLFAQMRGLNLTASDENILVTTVFNAPG